MTCGKAHFQVERPLRCTWTLGRKRNDAAVEKMR
jgi:hypothetical protein